MKNTDKNKFFLQKISNTPGLTTQAYARGCYDYTAWNGKLDKVFLQVFAHELQECGYQENYSEILEQLQRNPVLQTAHHLTPTNGPTLTAIDLISLLGLEEKYYLVGVFTGVSFSNTAFSGALSYRDLTLAEIIRKDSYFYRLAQKENKNRNFDLGGRQEQRIRLILAKYNNDLIFGSNFDKYRLDLWDSFTTKTLKFFAKPQIEQSVVNWSLSCCANLQKNVFQKKEIIYFDLCRLVREYLVVKLMEKSNPLKEILKDFKKIEKNLDIIWFYTRIKGKKSWKIQSLMSKDLDFFQYVREGDFTAFVQFLKNNNNCPSSFLVFLVVTFFLGIRTLGSFHQIIYLPKYEEVLKKTFPLAESEGKLLLSHSWGKSFTSGRLKTREGDFYPMDHVFHDKFIILKKFQNTPITLFWKNLLGG